MEPVLTALLVASGGGALFRLLKWSNRSRRRAWREAAEANGIEVAAESTAFGFFHARLEESTVQFPPGCSRTLMVTASLSFRLRSLI